MQEAANTALTTHCANLNWIVSELPTEVGTSDGHQCATIDRTDLWRNVRYIAANVEDETVVVQQSELVVSNADLIETAPCTSEHASDLLFGVVNSDDIHLSEICWVRDVGCIH